ncbi:PREDICTED: uncharacterized protein LOC106808645 [Priapulus caudatus]|uniref:Uncharacterized protein LOC106808645 n=1 Tax=Priapulus caudatus TaxID=37621 RepID=A0ABM1E415_PRICU|nr:PREDICTED: uncharacterized protein LOC106808645 [Priapulus caudatus]
MEESDEKALSLEELLTWSNMDLKEWCIKHGIARSGNKHQMAKRVYRGMHYDDSTSGSSDEDDAVDSPTVTEPSSWTPVTTDNIPPIRSSDVTNYFVYHKNPLAGAKLTSKRQQRKAKKFVADEYVRDLTVGHGTPANISHVRAQCQPSMKAAPYRTRVSIAETGMVQGGECTCKSGQSGVCSHVGALLLSLVKICDACTSQTCQWKTAPTGNVRLEPALSSNIRIYNPEKDIIAKSRPYPGVYSAGPAVDGDAFLKDLLDGMATCNSDSALYLTLRNTPGDITDFTDLFEVDRCLADHVDLSAAQNQSLFEAFLAEYSESVTETMIENLERSTRGQGINLNWRKARSVILTASHMGSIVKRQKVELDALVKTIAYPKVISGQKSLNYGNKNECKARREYAKWHIKQCGSVVVEDRGLIVSRELPFIGASIDGHVECPKCGEGIVEIKCPYGTKQHAFRNLKPQTCAEATEFCSQLKDGKLILKSEHNYMYQVQGQMGVCRHDNHSITYVHWKMINGYNPVAILRFTENPARYAELFCQY